MGFWKKLCCCCWRKRNVAVRTRDISTETEIVTSENVSQVSSLDMSVTCDVGTQEASNVTCDASTQTIEVIEEKRKRTDGGAVEEEKELKREITEMDKILEEKDRQIRKLQATLHEMKLQHRNEIQRIKTMEQMGKSSLLRKISSMRRQITHLKERRLP